MLYSVLVVNVLYKHEYHEVLIHSFFFVYKQYYYRTKTFPLNLIFQKNQVVIC